MPFADIAPSPLEDWLRERYFTATVDISSSGVADYSLGELRRLLDIPVEELDAIPLRDSPSHGSPELRAAIAGRYGVPEHHVMVTHGSTEGIFLALSALLDPGDEAVVLRPVYQSLSSVAAATGVRLRTWDLDAADGFRPDLQRLADLLTPRTRAVIVNFPHNPTGVSLNAREYGELLDLVSAHGAHLVWDAAFADLAHDAPPLPDPVTRYGRSVSFGTLSKAYGLPGMRVGWCVAPPGVLDRMVRLRDYTTLNTSPVSEYLATAAVSRADALIGPRLAQAGHNRQLLDTWVAARPADAAWRRPDGGVAAFPRVLGIADTTELCTELAREHGVLVVPGACFGEPAHLRIGFGGPSGDLETGLSALATVIGRHKRREAAR